MNKEEIDNLENYLKNELPKTEPTIPIASFDSVDLDDLMNNIRQFKKVPTADELLKENKSLRSQLEQKNKIINEVFNKIETLRMEKWAIMGTDIMEILEILERGKNGK